MGKSKQQQELEHFTLLHENHKRTAEEEEIYKQLLDKYGAQVLKDPSVINKIKTSDNVDYGAQIKADALKSISQDYETETREKVQQIEGRPHFAFSNKEEAITFFAKQAQKGRPFEAYNKSLDHCMYSDGKNFVQGTKAEVEAYKKNPDNYDIGVQGGLTPKTAPEEGIKPTF
ncbi:MAG: hypothetical protein KBB94_02440 [Legionellaceae bacterium]|nr:hypothetical protein [Legionellaceae bacterium]MBP9774952.1 hypothetical protein [Legionellaceae bacterium]